MPFTTSADAIFKPFGQPTADFGANGLRVIFRISEIGWEKRTRGVADADA